MSDLPVNLGKCAAIIVNLADFACARDHYGASVHSQSVGS